MVNDTLRTLAGSEMVIVRNWHISTFTFLVAFVILYIFFYTFQPTTLLDTESFLVKENNEYSQATSKSDKEKNNKLLTDHGRVLVFAWSLGLGALVGLIVHFILIYI